MNFSLHYNSLILIRNRDRDKSNVPVFKFFEMFDKPAACVELSVFFPCKLNHYTIRVESRDVRFVPAFIEPTF